MTRITTQPFSPLEQFLRDYIEARDGVWDEIEPSVYDALIGPEMMQAAFDPEALQEHPGAQLASLGSPLFDRLLCDAAERWNSARLYRLGLNLHPRNLEANVTRAITLPPRATIQIEKIRAMNCPQAIFWFKSTFTSDQREEEMLPVGIDLHYAREVRQLDALLALERLSEMPDMALPEAPHAGLTRGYEAARSNVTRSILSLANARRRDWSGTVEKRIARMSGYYAQLRQEAAEQTGRAADAAIAQTKERARLETIDREERLRIAELKRKSALRVEVKLSNLMLIGQPKLLIFSAISLSGRPRMPLVITFDPLSESVEAVPCVRCGRPTFALEIDRAGLKCPGCPGGSG